MLSYRKVGYLEQIYYIIKYAVKNKFKKKKHPKIRTIFVNGYKRTDWTYDRNTGDLEFKKAVPAGSKIEIIFWGKSK